MDWSALDFSGLANAFLALVTAIIAAAALAIGRRAKPPPKESSGMEISGAAIVSSESIQMLTKEIAANTVAVMQYNRNCETYRKAQYQSIESMNRATAEMNDLHQSMQRLTLELARRGR